MGFSALPHGLSLVSTRKTSQRTTMRPFRNISGYLRSPALFAYALTGGNAVAAFLATLVISRAAGPEVLGNYGFSVLTGTLLSLFAIRGLDQIGLRKIAGDLRMDDTAAARGVVGYVSRATLHTSLAVTAVFEAAILILPDSALLGIDRTTLMLGGVGIITTTLHRMGVTVVRAMGQPVAAQFYESINSLLFFIMLAIIWWVGHSYTAALAVSLYYACQLIPITIVWRAVRSQTRAWQTGTPPDKAAISKAGIPILAIRSAQLFADWVLLAFIAGAVNLLEVGAMRVALQCILIINLVFITADNYLAARVAGDTRAARPDLAWARYRRATLGIAALAGPIVAVFIAFPTPLLTLAFGPEFAVASPALAIMSIGQASKLLTGPIGGLLNMAGLEHKLLLTTLAGLALLLVLAAILVPLWGITGAATAHAASVTLRNVAGYVVARRNISRSPPP
jgi:O-antigen/teichoic acid export membrane protein